MPIMISRSVIFHKNRAFNVASTMARLLDCDAIEHRHHMHVSMIDFAVKVLTDISYASLIDFETPIPDPMTGGRQLVPFGLFLWSFGVQDLTVEWYNGNNDASDDSSIDTFALDGADMDDDATITTAEEVHLAVGVHMLNNLTQDRREIDALIDGYYAEQEEKDEDNALDAYFATQEEV